MDPGPSYRRSPNGVIPFAMRNGGVEEGILLANGPKSRGHHCCRPAVQPALNLRGKRGMEIFREPERERERERERE